MTQINSDPYMMVSGGQNLTNALNAWLKRTGAKMPTPNPDFNPDHAIEQ
jgi:hypothetical protein